MEAVKTNIIGTDNVLTAAIEEGVEAVICLSTDKAAYPINMHYIYVEPTKYKADIIVNGGKNKNALDLVINKIDKFLSPEKENMEDVTI